MEHRGHLYRDGPEAHTSQGGRGEDDAEGIIVDEGGVDDGILAVTMAEGDMVGQGRFFPLYI